MLNLFSLKERNSIIKPVNLKKIKKTSKHFPSSLREWKNSIYVYNKNSLNLIPSTTVSITNIIKSYFNLYNKGIESMMRTKRLLLRLRRLSSNKYFINIGGFKHTNNKVLINLYVFNRQKTNYLLSIKNWYLKTFLRKIIQKKDINVKLIKKLNIINEKGVESVEILLNNKYFIIRNLNKYLNNKEQSVNNFVGLSKIIEDFHKRLIIKSLKKLRMYFYYKQLLYINKSKLNYTYLQYLKTHLEKSYNKNVEFNIINLKRFYLSSDILSESITIKLTRNRRKIFKYLNNLKNKVNISENILIDSIKQPFGYDNILLQKYITKNLNYKHVTGFRLEAKGRLSRRYTASRSVYKLRYKGNLLDINSSYKGLSSVLLKGNLKSNTQYTKLKSKSRIGSFGIKGWISGN